MTKKSIAIIGGGITGCITALAAVKKGLNVSLFEKNNKLGGVLNDVKTKDSTFFTNCQYFDPNILWYKELIDKKFDLIKFEHDKASYTDMFNEDLYVHGIAGPSVSKKIKIKFAKEKKLTSTSLMDRFGYYPKVIKSNLKKWITRHGCNPSKISWNCPDNFATGRIFFRNNVEDIAKMKKNCAFHDSLLGLSDSERGLKSTLAALPKNGYDKFFEKIYKVFQNEGVKIFLSSVIKPYWKKDNIYLYYKNKELFFDNVFWSGNPTGLIKSYGLPLLDSECVKSKKFYFNIKGEIKNNLYIQVYSSKVPISRLFFYRLDKKSRLTIECFSKDISVNETIKFSNKIIKKIPIKINIREKDLQTSADEKKYIVTTIRDEKIINEFLQKTKKSNLLPGCWLKFTRDSKINSILNELEKRI